MSNVEQAVLCFRCQSEIAAGHIRLAPGGLDPGIARAVEILMSHGVETYESCEGGPGHSFAEPTIRFHGGPAAGWNALAAAITYALPVQALGRIWTIQDGEPVGPSWEMVFYRQREAKDDDRTR